MTFKAWMKKVDAAVSVTAGLSVYDLPDMPFYDMFNDDYTPEEAAEETLMNAGW